MSSSGQTQGRHSAAVDVGCSCWKTKLSSLFSSAFSSSRSAGARLKPADPFSSNAASSSDCSGEVASPKREGAKRRRRRRREEEGRGGRENVVVVETSEPYRDFKESMVQMIEAKEMYGWDELNDLLHRFLSLNSPRHHHVILRAFADLWNSVFSPPSPLAAAVAPDSDDRSGASGPPSFA